MRFLLAIALLVFTAVLDSDVRTQEPESPPPMLSDAEKIVKLKRELQQAREELQPLKKEVENPPEEYRRLERDLNKLDEQLTAKEKELKDLASAGKTAEAKKLEESLTPLRKEHQAANDRFELAVKERKVLRDKAEALETQIDADQQELDRLTGNEKPAAPPPEDPATKPDTPTKDAEAKDSTPKEIPGEDKELAKARMTAMQKAEEARQAMEKAESIKARVENLRKGIHAEQSLLKMSREKAEFSQKTIAELEATFQKEQAGGADPQTLKALRDKIDLEEQRLAEARSENRAAQNQLAKLQADMSLLQAEQLTAMQEAERKQEEAREAEDLSTILAKPFLPRNIARWVGAHGPRIVGIILLTLVLRWLVLLVTSRRITAHLARRQGRWRQGTGEVRAETLVGVFRYALTVGVVVIGGLMILDEMGIPITTLMGGAAVMGLAISFGAQNLLKDFFTGFMILVEDQYSVGDVVKINEHSGTVEQITLRVTVLRDLSGKAHFIPNGVITSVINMTHTWSRAFFEINVAHKENPNHVIEVLKELCAELRADEQFRDIVLEDAEILGVDAITDSAITIKFFVKTKPLKQWQVQREMLRRIKCRFDELGIEIPHPRRTVYVQHSQIGNGENEPQANPFESPTES